jgi:hypothetical protein
MFKNHYLCCRYVAVDVMIVGFAPKDLVSASKVLSGRKVRESRVARFFLVQHTKKGKNT